MGGTRVGEQLLDARDHHLGYAGRRIGDPVPADDILQNCLLGGIRADLELPVDARVIPWLHCVLRA